MNQNFELLRVVTQRMKEQRIRQREAVREALIAARLPVPQGIVKDLALLRPEDARDVLKDHPGFKIWQRWKSYKAALAVFERSVRDLFEAIDALADQMRDENLFTKPNQHKLDEGELHIHKELFAAGNAAHSLKDHASYRLQEVACVPEFKSKQAEHFGQDGLHDFVIALRTITHHIDVVEPGYHVTHRFGGETDEITFHLDRDELRAIVESVKAEGGKYKINKPGRDYLDNAPAKIDVRATFQAYFERARAFHDWFKGTLERQPTSELQDFERCLKANKDNAARTSWKMLLGIWLKNWKTPPNPYDHLHKYLAAEQLEEVERLSRKSREQVDKVIEFVDEDNACDDEIRELAYELFARAPD